jgi:hypothetical protein
MNDESEPFDDTIPFNEKTPFERQISDETAFALSNALHWLALACDDKYLGQILRHMKIMDETRPVDPEQPWLRNPLPK